MLIHLLSPMHVGGTYEFSVVDQPIQREGHTGFPKIEASSLKGSIRHHYVRTVKDNAQEKVIFGDTDYAGKLTFTDARILFFPVRSAKGVYALLTCPIVLNRYMQEEGKNITVNIDGNQGHVTSTSTIKLENSNNVLLDEYLYEQVEENLEFNTCIKYVEGRMSGVDIASHAFLISDDEFTYFVKHNTEIITRTAINHETGIVTTHALFDEEYVPTETIFYTTIHGEQAYISELDLDILQIGGNMTLGKGFVKVHGGGQA